MRKVLALRSAADNVRFPLLENLCSPILQSLSNHDNGDDKNVTNLHFQQ